MSGKLYGALCLALVISAGAATANDDVTDATPKLSLTLRGWNADIDAESSLVKGLFGGKLDLDDELGMGSDTVPELRVRWQFKPRHAFEFRVLKLAYDGNDIVARPLWFDDKPTFFFSPVKADIELLYAKLGWRWAIVAPESGKFRLETMLDITGGKAEAEYEQYNILWPFWPANRDDADIAGALPTLGLAATLAPVPWAELFGEVSGMTAGSHGHTLDFEIGLRVKPLPWLAVEAGYRYLSIKGKDDDDDAEFEFSGPFVGAQLRF